MDNQDDGYDEPFDDDELDDDDEPPKKKKRVATSTKVLLVIAGWILLTLFLVGEFSKSKSDPTDTASAELETTTAEEFDDGGTPDIVDTEAEAEFDLDGDGFLDETERSAAIEAFEASVEAGEVAIGESDVSDAEGGGSGAYPGPDGETAETAVPGAAPGSGGGTSGGSGTATTTTAKPAGGGGGSPTTTAAPVTTKPGGGGGTTSTTPTTAAPPPPPPTTEAPGDPVELSVSASGLQFQYPSGYSKNLSLPAGSTISFKNNEASANIDHSFTIVDGWDSGAVNKNSSLKTSPGLAKGTYDYRCKIHPATMNGTLTVT